MLSVFRSRFATGNITSLMSLLVDHLADAIFQRIVDGALGPGLWLRQESLAREFEVSRMPVREALRKLEQAGIVEFVANRGFRVYLPTAQEIEDAYVVRAELEGLAAERAAVRITASQLSGLQHASELFERAGSAFAALNRDSRLATQAQAEWVHANDLFHTGVQEAADNDRLRKTIADLHRAFPRSLTSLPLVEDPALMRDNIAEHQIVLRALEDRDPLTSRRAMSAHVLLAGQLVGRWFARLSEKHPGDDRATKRGVPSRALSSV
jgi:DNA-binding GntR family transcriptional regulator